MHANGAARVPMHGSKPDLFGVLSIIQPSTVSASVASASGSDNDGSESWSCSTSDGTGSEFECCRVTSRRTTADRELRGLLAQRDSINASIEEYVRRRGLELPTAHDVTEHSYLEFVSPEVERKWREEGCGDQVVLASLFLGLCEVILRGETLYQIAINPCGYEAMAEYWWLRATLAYNILAICLLVPLPILNLLWRNMKLHLALVILAYADRLVASFPLLHIACTDRRYALHCYAPREHACELLEYYRFQRQMFSVMAQVLILPEYRYCVYMWGWVFLAALVAAIFVAEDDNYLSSAKNEFFVRFVLLALVQMVANRKKRTMEEQLRSLFLTVLKSRDVSRSMFQILEFMVPSFVILPMLKYPGETHSYHYEGASVLFIAFHDFESVVQRTTPPELLDYLNMYYNHFDWFCAKRGVTKIETVAEEYVCAVGVEPRDACRSSTENVHKLIDMALDILFMEIPDGMSFKMGIHTGPIVAGVVGSKLPRYRLFGDTINSAARMMQKGLPGEVQFGEQTKAILPDSVKYHCRGPVEMKGKGQVMTYLLDHVKHSRNNTHIKTNVLLARNRTPRAWHSAVLEGKRCAEGPVNSDHLEIFNDVLRELEASETAERKWYHCSQCCPAWADFSADREREFQKWYHNNVLRANFTSKRLSRQTLFLVCATLGEAAYILFLNSALVAVEEFWNGVLELKVYFCLRTVALFVSIVMGTICPALLRNRHTDRAMRIGRVVAQAGHFIFVVLVMLSYMLLPRYANNGSDAVPDNVVALLFFPVYSAFMISYQLQSSVALTYFAGFSLVILVVFVSPGSDENGYPSEGVAFMGYSLIFVMKAFIGERSLRSQFKARQAIDVAKTRIEGILDSMMPKLVINELQRLSHDDALPSHHYFRATVVQSDLAGFTRLAGSKTPEEVVRTVSHLFGLFDDEADRLGIYKVETVGDAYIGGQAEPPLTEENHPPNVIDFGLSMVKATQRWARESGEDIQCRVGVHYGECRGGIVGTDKQRYHLFGTLIHQLELLEATAPPNRVQVSSSCKEAAEAAWEAARSQAAPDPAVQTVQSTPFRFFRRPEPALVTSKGERHEFASVGGRTFLIQAWRSESLLSPLRV